MTLVQTVDPRVSRDIESRALVAANVSELAKARAARSASKKTITQFQTTEHKIAELDGRLRKIESLLQTLVNRERE